MMYTKLLTLLFLLSSLSLFGEELHEVPTEKRSDLYFGIDLFKSNLEFAFDNVTLNTSTSQETDSQGVRLKFGALAEDDWRVQGHLSIEEIDDNVFSITSSDGTLYELGADVIKGFEVTKAFKPFVLIGFSYGSMHISGYNEPIINNVGLKAGLGAFYRINTTLELTAGFDLQYRAWTSIERAAQTIEPSDTASTLYIGLNTHF